MTTRVSNEQAALARRTSGFGRTAIAAMLAIGAVFGSAPARAQQEDAVRETHGSWEVRCVADNSFCYMTQTALDQEGQPLFKMRLRKLPEAVERDGKSFVVEAELSTRLGFYLPAGIQMRIDQGKPAQLPFERCVSDGCGSLPVFSQQFIDEMRTGGASIFTMMFEPGKLVEASISLSGFTAAYDSL